MSRLIPLLLFLCTTLTGFAQTPTWSIVDHGLTAFAVPSSGVGTPSVQGFSGIAFGNGIFVATANSTNEGVIRWATSPDGQTWTARSQAIAGGQKSFASYRVHFQNGKFVFITEQNDGAYAYSSTDGLTWTGNKIANSRHILVEHAASDTLTVAVGNDQEQFSSTDLATWTARPVTQTAQIYSHTDVAFGAGRFLSTMNGWDGQTYSSADGITWTAVTGLAAPGGYRVEFGHGIFLAHAAQNLWTSTDGVTFTKQTPTGTAPGAGNSVRFTGGRFLNFIQTAFLNPSKYGFSASTNGKDWVSFGEFTPPAGGTLFLIADVTYGNGKYVLAANRVVATAGGNVYEPVIVTATASEGTAGGGGEEPTGGEFTLAYQVGVTPIPGSTTPVAANLQGYTIHDGGVLIAAPTAGTPLRAALLQHKDDELTVVLDSTNGFPGGGAIHSMELVNDGTRVFITPRTATSFAATHAALLKYEGGSLSTLIADSDAVIADKEGFTHSSLIAQEAGNNRVAIIGGGGFATSYLYRYQDSALTTVVAKGITAQPNGTGDGKFAKIESAALSPDGSRLFFLANNGVNVTLPEARFGIYVEQGGAISTVVDNTTTIPGTSAPFSFRGESIGFGMSPDGSRTIVMGTEYTEGTARHGIYEYANGSLTTLVDNTAVVGTQELITIMDGVITNDGTLIFYGGGMHPTSLYRAKDGQITLIQSGGTDAGFRTPQGLWLHGDYVYFKATNASIQPILARIPVDGSEGATEVINFYTHPDFAAIDTRDLEDLQFANGLVLLNVGAVHEGVQRSAILYGPASLLEGESTGGGSTTTPQISTQPVAKSTAPGGSVTFTVSATGNNLTYQWKRGGQAISGATSASLTIDSVDASDAGTYTVDVTNSAGTVTSSGATLTVLSPSEYGRLSAISIRAQVGTGDNVLIAGYAIGPGSASLPVLVRGSGPSLANLGVPSASTLQDPQISIVPPGQTVAVASNDNWAGNDDVLTKSAELGAQPFASTTSADAGVYLTGLASGPYTAVVSGKDNGTGIALVEVYAGSTASTAPRLTAISGRSTIGAGNDVLIAGFVVHGASTRVLVRGVGPSLAGVAARLSDPQIALHAAGNSTAMATNNDWGSAANASEAATLAAQVGATAFTSGSKDAAMLVTLEPGVYTAVVSGVASSSGIAVVEVYEVP